MNTEMATPKPKLKFRSVNFRLIAFLAIVSMPFVWFAYSFINETLTGGIERGSDFSKVDLKSLGFYEFDQNNGTINDIPRKWRNLDGQRVQLEGFMFSNLGANRVRDFQFVYNITKCCFSGPPLIQERVFIHVPSNRPPMPLRSDLFMRMTGILHVKVDTQDGTIKSVYTLDVDAAEPVT